MKSINKQPWLGRPMIDIVFILLPPFVSLLFIFLFPGTFRDTKGMPEAWWVLLILLIDVAHVYSTLYRTYFDRQLRRSQRSILYLIPVLGFIAAFILYSYSYLAFWRVLAYLAVFHFVRQQYGFMRLYSRNEENPRWMRLLDKWTIYYATLYPMLYWHLSGPKNFNWFTDGDFLLTESRIVLQLATALYVLVLAAYLFKEIYFGLKTRSVNIPKVAVIGGTLMSWYFGIVYFNGDMAFTLLNVVSHGIPYMALIWIYGKKRSAGGQDKLLSVFFSRYGLLLFLGLIFLLAYVEEGLWDSVLWKEHRNVFGLFYTSGAEANDQLLNVLVPLLALPQITHYVIDGFIWKVKGKKPAGTDIAEAG